MNCSNCVFSKNSLRKNQIRYLVFFPFMILFKFIINLIKFIMVIFYLYYLLFYLADFLIREFHNLKAQKIADLNMI